MTEHSPTILTMFDEKEVLYVTTGTSLEQSKDNPIEPIYGHCS